MQTTDSISLAMNAAPAQLNLSSAILPHLPLEQSESTRSLRTIGKVMLVLGAFSWFRPEVSLVRGQSMNPNIQDGNRVVLVANTEISRFDIVTFPCPAQPDSIYIKRVIGLPGESISLHGDKLYVNGGLVEQPKHELDYRGFCEVKVPADSIFVLGDNRPHSSDSREFGCVKIGTVKEMICRF